jgi:ArsR family transcriptional regulator
MSKRRPSKAKSPRAREEPPAGKSPPKRRERPRGTASSQPPGSPAPSEPAAAGDGPRPQCCPDIGALLDSRFFKALSDTNRIAIVGWLAGCDGPRPVSRVNACCNVDLSVVSRHLAMLRDAGILTAERHGKEVRYSVRYSETAQTLRRIAEAIEACCPPEKSHAKPDTDDNDP